MTMIKRTIPDGYDVLSAGDTHIITATRTTYRGLRAIKFSSGQIYAAADMTGSRWFSDREFFERSEWNKLFLEVYASLDAISGDDARRRLAAN